MAWPSEYDFLKDPAMDTDTKKLLLQGLLDEKKFAREAPMEQKRFWHNTPLMLALVGTITIAANGLVTYVQASRAASDTVTLEQLKSQLKDSEGRSAATRTAEASDAEAKRTATREEREFAFKIVEKELAKTGDSSARATVLLFLVRAGVLNGLNRDELEKMAVAQIERAGKDPSQIGIPPTLGRSSIRVEKPENVDFKKVIYAYDDGTLGGPPSLLLMYSTCERVHVDVDSRTFVPRISAISPLISMEGGPHDEAVWVSPLATWHVSGPKKGWGGNAIVEIFCGGQSVTEVATDFTPERVRDLLKPSK